MNLRETFRFNFKRLRQRNKLSQKRVAEMFSISPQSISKWERGEGYPSIEYLPELAEVFHCNINEFFLPLPDEEDDEHFTVFSLLSNLALMEECRDADFEDYTIEEFTSYATEIIEDVLKEPLNSHLCPKDFLKQFTQALYNIIVSTVHVYLVNSEIIFWGYGEEDLFPSYFSFIISSAFDGRIKFTNKSAYVVSNINNACVEPFAQTDVANTVVRGIDDDLRKKFYDSYKASITVFRDEIISQLDSAGAPEVLKDALLKIDLENYTNLYVQGMDLYIQDNYIAKLVNTVSYLSKEDLADMAESLVRMTYLKRRITSEEESVGGPVDVAVITKGDGFVWLKRKHYFSAELNPHYFERTNID